MNAKESLLSTVSENWTLIFKSRKSEKPCMDYWAKKIGKNRPKACSKHVWTLLETIKSNFWILMFFDCFENFRRLGHPWNTGRNCFLEKLPQNMFKASFDKIGNDFRHFWIFEKFGIFRIFSKTPWNTGQKNFFKKIGPKHVQNTFEYFCERFWAFLDFWNFSKTRPSMEHWGKNFFRRKMLQNTFGHLRTILDSFRTLKPSWFFSWIFSKYLPRNLSPENRIQIVLVQKTEHIVLSSGIWTHNFKSRKSGKGLRIMTVAWMQTKCLLSIVS